MRQIVRPCVLKVANRAGLLMAVVGVVIFSAPHIALATKSFWYGQAHDTADLLGLPHIDGAEATQYFGDLGLSCYSCGDHIDEDLWVTDNQAEQNWVESGILMGEICTYAPDHTSYNCDNGNGTTSCCFRVPRFFWGDQRPSGGYNLHIDVSDSPGPGYYVDSIRKSGSETWDTSIGQGSTNWTGTSTSNTMVAVAMKAGIEIYDGNVNNAFACTGQSNLSYWDDSNTFQSRWPNAYTEELGPNAPPPFSKFVGTADVHSWNPDDSETTCY